MGTSGISRRRRARPIAVESLEGRALLSAAAATSPTAVQAPRMPVVHGTSQGAPAPTVKSGAADVAHVGQQGAKLVFSSPSRRVGWAYTKAVVFGNVNDLQDLGHTRAVRQVAQNFKNLGHSPEAKSISHAFNRLGKSISDQFHKLFD